MVNERMASGKTRVDGLAIRMAVRDPKQIISNKSSNEVICLVLYMRKYR